MYFLIVRCEITTISGNYFFVNKCLMIGKTLKLSEL